MAVGEVQDRTSSSGEWMLRCDCSTCPRGFYPEMYPSKGPYASEADCRQELYDVVNRPGAGACERCYCEGSGGGASGGGSGSVAAVKSGVSAAVSAAQELAARNANHDSGKDLLAPSPGAAAEDDGAGARYGIGRRRPRGPKPKPKPTPEAKPYAGKVKLLRTPVDEGGPIIAKPYINCATLAAELQRRRNGGEVMRDQLKKTRAMLESAESGRADANEKARERSKEFATGAALDIALEANKKLHALQKGVGRLMEEAAASRQARAAGQQLLREMQRTHDRAQKMVGVAKQGNALYEAGGADAYMRSSLEGLQASYNKAWSDPAVREELLNFCGETLSDLGGPAAALAFKTVKYDIDIAALSASQGLDRKEAEKHLRNLEVMERELDANVERIRFLEKEGEAQCKKM